MSSEEDELRTPAEAPGKSEVEEKEMVGEEAGEAKEEAAAEEEPVPQEKEEEKTEEKAEEKAEEKEQERKEEEEGKPAIGNKYTFFVGPGNNSELVRQTIERRPWWELGKEDDPELNLKWLQVRSRSVAEQVRRAGSKQFLNHLEGLSCIGRKNELYQNLKQYCEREKINVHEIAPPTFIVTVGEICPEYAEFQRVCRQLENKVKGTIGKSLIGRSTSGGEGASNARRCDLNIDDSSADCLSRDLSQRKAAGWPAHRDKNLWILKPTNNNRGNGIRVFKCLLAVDEHLKRKPPGSQVVVQKYIERPLLYKGRKFDIRVLVLVDNNMQVYVYRDAYLRTSTCEYDIDNVQDLFIHLTNYAVQKKKKKKGEKRERELEEDEIDEDEEEPQEEGNNLSLAELSAFIAEAYDGVIDSTHVMNRINEIVVTVMLSVWKRLNPLREKNTFEVFGWDFLLDEEFNVWLIEVNTNPYIGCSSGLLRSIFTGMLEGAARKCLDPYFPPPPGFNKEDIPDVPGADLWDKVYPPDTKKSAAS